MSRDDVEIPSRGGFDKPWCGVALFRSSDVMTSACRSMTSTCLEMLTKLVIAKCESKSSQSRSCSSHCEIRNRRVVKTQGKQSIGEFDMIEPIPNEPPTRSSGMVSDSVELR